MSDSITREEMLLNSIANSENSNLSPITREEQYLSYIAGETNTYPIKPITRKEFYLDKIAKSDISGGGSGINVQPLTIKENGNYYAPQGIAYSPIIVDVQSEENRTRIIIFQNGNAGNTMMPAPIFGIIGEEIPTLPIPQMSNYNFEGWYLDYACTIPFEETTFRENLTIYAKWVYNVSEQINILSLNADNSNSTIETGKIKTAIKEANNPEIICLQSVGTAWKTASISGYTASLQNKNTQNCLIYYNTDKFTAEASGLDTYFSYIILRRKSDDALLTVVDVLFDNSVEEEVKLEKLWERINGVWEDGGRGIMPMIIAGSFGNNMTADSVSYKGLTENSIFVDAYSDAKSILTTSIATTGDYVFASYHTKNSVERYDLLTNTGSHYGLVVNVAVPKV